MNTTTCPTLLPPEQIPCWPGGACTTSPEICACPETLGGPSSFVFGSTSCLVFVPLVRGLWGATAGTNALSGLYVGRFLLQQGLSKNSEGRNSAFSLLISNAMLVSVGIVRIVDWNRVIARDGLVTSLFCIGCVAFWFGLILSLRMVARVMLGGDQVATRAVLDFLPKKVWNRVVSFCFVVAFVGGFAPLGGLAANSTFGVFASATAHYDLLAMNMLVVGVTFYSAFSRMLRSIRGSLSAVDLEKKLVYLMNGVFQQCLSNIVIAVAFGSIPFLTRLADYQLPIVYGVATPIMTTLIVHFHTPTASSSSSKHGTTTTSQKSGMDADIVATPEETCVLPAHHAPLRESDTVFHSNFLSRRFTQRNQKKELILLVTSLVVSSTLIGVTLSGAAPSPVAWLYIVPSVVIACGFGATSVSIPLLQRLVRTSQYVQIRICVSILQAALFTQALASDVNLAFVPFTLMIFQVGAFCSDAFVYPGLRVVVVAAALGPSLVSMILIVWDLIPIALNVVLNFGPGYSVFQATRDLALAQFTMLVFECAFLVRGRHVKRYLHLGVPITRVVIPFAPPLVKVQVHDDNNPTDEPTELVPHVTPMEVMTLRGARKDVNASSVFLQSGFMVHDSFVERETLDSKNDDVFRPPTLKRRVYVMKLALKEKDALIVHLLGETKGRVAMNIINGKAFRILYVLSFFPPLAFALSLPFYQVPSLAYLALVPSFIVAGVRDFGTSSRVALLLILSRLEFWFSLFFLLIWVVMSAIVLADARIILILFGFSAKLGELFSDAIVTNRFSTWRHFGVFIKTGPLFFAFAITYVLSDVYRAADILLNVNGGIEYVSDINTANTTINSNAVNVIDIEQSASDLALGFALHSVIRATWAIAGEIKRYRQGIHRPENEMTMEFVHAPVSPVSDAPETSTEGDTSIPRRTSRVVETIVEMLHVHNPNLEVVT